ncbi:TIGR04255 family protein [Pseudomonas sp. W5-36]|uniref:TIGR04255 family protein n=1 Tax=Pseudomonas sp. W5-36 TaxID=3097455 RepID=UPI003979FCE4
MLKPISEAHSIESISLICEFSGEVDGNGLAVVRDEASRLKVKFPIRRTIRKGRPDAHDPQGSLPDVVGHAYINKLADKEVTRFDILQSRASFTSKAYTDFNSFLAEASFALSIAYQAYAKSGHNIDRIILSYRDEFVSDNIDWPIQEALNPETKYIAKACLREGDFWHSQIGVFDSELPRGLPLLHNIKVSHVIVTTDDTEPTASGDARYVLAIDLLHVLKVAEVDTGDSFSAMLEENAHALRNYHKTILKDMLSDSMAEKIGLARHEGR